MTTAHFSEPGAYVIRGMADDGYLYTSADVTVTVTPLTTLPRWRRGIAVATPGNLGLLKAFGSGLIDVDDKPEQGETRI